MKLRLRLRKFGIQVLPFAFGLWLVAIMFSTALLSGSQPPAPRQPHKPLYLG